MSRLKGHLGRKFSNYLKKFPSRYSFIYKLHLYTKEHVCDFKQLSSALLLLVVLLTTVVLNDHTTSDYIKMIPFALYSLAVITVLFLGYLIQYHLVNTGVLQNFIFSGTRLIRGKSSEGFRLNADGIDNTLYKFATEDMIDIVADLNARAYSGGLWGTGFESKRKRNLQHIQQNPNSIMLFKFEHDGPFVGFTHIFPVNSNVWDEYINGKIADNDFSANNIATVNPQTKDEYPFGLILFSIGCPEINPREYGPERRKEYKNYLGEFLEKAQVYHIDTLLKMHFTSNTRYRMKMIDALLQNEDENYINFYNGYADMSARSKDDCTIIKFKILNHHIK